MAIVITSYSIHYTKLYEDHHLKPVLNQLLRRNEGLGDVREQRLFIAQHFEFHERVTVQQFARELAGASYNFV